MGDRAQRQSGLHLVFRAQANLPAVAKERARPSRFRRARRERLKFEVEATLELAANFTGHRNEHWRDIRLEAFDDQFLHRFSAREFAREETGLAGVIREASTKGRSWDVRSAS
jgi:hypothetical protein